MKFVIHINAFAHSLEFYRSSEHHCIQMIAFATQHHKIKIESQKEKRESSCALAAGVTQVECRACSFVSTSCAFCRNKVPKIFKFGIKFVNFVGLTETTRKYQNI